MVQVKSLLAMQETWLWFLGQEDTLEKGMANHSSILAWRIPWTEKPDKLQSIGPQRVGPDWATNTSPIVELSDSSSLNFSVHFKMLIPNNWF